jgi:hypothetical protein
MTNCSRTPRIYEIRFQEADFRGLFVIKRTSTKGALDLGQTTKIAVPKTRVVEVTSLAPIQKWHQLEAFDVAGNPFPVWKGEHLAGVAVFPLQGNDGEFWYYVGPESEFQALQKQSLSDLEQLLQQSTSAVPSPR